MYKWWFLSSTNSHSFHWKRSNTKRVAIIIASHEEIEWSVTVKSFVHCKKSALTPIHQYDFDVTCYRSTCTCLHAYTRNESSHKMWMTGCCYYLLLQLLLFVTRFVRSEIFHSITKNVSRVNKAFGKWWIHETLCKKEKKKSWKPFSC